MCISKHFKTKIQSFFMKRWILKIPNSKFCSNPHFQHGFEFSLPGMIFHQGRLNLSSTRASKRSTHILYMNQNNFRAVNTYVRKIHIHTNMKTNFFIRNIKTFWTTRSLHKSFTVLDLGLWNLTAFKRSMLKDWEIENTKFYLLNFKERFFWKNS